MGHSPYSIVTTSIAGLPACEINNYCSLQVYGPYWLILDVGQPFTFKAVNFPVDSDRHKKLGERQLDFGQGLGKWGKANLRDWGNVALLKQVRSQMVDDGFL